MELGFEDYVMVARDEAADLDDQSTAGSSSPYLDDISQYVDDIADLLWPVNQKIHDNPELCYKEYIAHETLTSFLKTRPGWKVTLSAYGIDTAWVAVYDTGKKGPVISFNAEMGACCPPE